MTDPFDLQRFVDAQDRNGSYLTALRELRSGQKRSHWMWYVFPQLAGLGRSSMARHFAISGVGEARAYLMHPVLGLRLLECVQELTALDTPDPVAVFGSIDAMKLRSSMTLFVIAAPDQPGFQHVLDQYFDGHADAETTTRL